MLVGDATKTAHGTELGMIQPRINPRPLSEDTLRRILISTSRYGEVPKEV